MDEKNETIADIVAEMRGFKRYAASDSRDCRYVAYWLYQTFADRIEAAHKREIEEIESDGIAKGINSMSEVCLKHGYFDDKHIVNGAKMREALEDSNGLLEELAAIGEWGESAREQIAKNNAALSTPPRNCDVGTADEQYRRHDAFCNATRKGMSGYHCKDTPRCVFCFSKWVQMPYEEGGVK